MLTKTQEQMKRTRNGHEQFCDYQFDNTGERKMFLPRHDLLSISVVGTVPSPRHRTVNEMDKSPCPWEAYHPKATSRSALT